MYPRRISQSIVTSQPNLKNLLLVNKHRHYFLKYSLMIRQKFNDLKNIKEVNKKLQEIIKNGKIFKLLSDCSTSKGSNNVLKVWVHHCECVFAQRLRRCQQMFCLYSKWWEEQAFKEFIHKMRQTLARKSKEFALGAIGVGSYNWKDNRISDQTIKEHAKELEYIHVLKDNTVCLACDSTNKKSANSSSVVCKCGSLSKTDRTYDNWTLFIEKNDLIVWRRLHPSGQFEYKVYGSYNDVSAEDFLNVQIDTDYRRKWDTTAVVLEVAETDPTPNSNSDIIYWEMLWPRLFVNRDYVFNRRYLVDGHDQLIYIVSQSTEHASFPKYPEKYRVEDYWSCMVIKPYTEMNEAGIEFSLSYFDNPGVNIPSSVTTWVSMRAMPDFLERLREATKGYRDYCKTQGISKACRIIKEEESAREEQVKKDKLEYCMFSRSAEKLEISSPRIIVRERGIKSPEVYSSSKPVNESDVKSERFRSKTSSRIIEKSSSEINTTTAPSSAAAQPENGNFWKYLHPLYYFH